MITTFQNDLLQAFAAKRPEDKRRLVFGEGQAEHPDIMLIGEAPGAQEEQQSRPFVGKAGKNLDEFLQVVELQRPELYISNVVKVRPCRVSEKGTVANRPPNREELAFFRPWLLREILLVQPRILVTLGNTALQSLTDAIIGDCHGQAQTVTLQQRAFTLFPLYHPASIIYNRSLASVYQEDLLRLKALLTQRI